MTLQTILIDLDNRGVATVSLNRPDVRNALNPLLIAELTNTITKLGQSDEIRVIVLKGEGKIFCAGADLAYMKDITTFGYDDNVKDALALGNLFATLDTCPKPTISVVQGGAYGGGVGLVATTDISIATSDSKFCLSEVRLGIIPGVISPYILKAIGQRHARKLALTAELIDSKAALACDLIHTISDSPHVTLDETLAMILQGSPAAQTATKELFRTINARPIDQDLQSLTANAIATARATPDGQEGLKAFLEKRQPNWIKKHD
ncbi:MAG: enoyl-CoA hydratase/isomerase family protein [Candidatus Paracaedibacteraceae bacterium]|nr:enoyl-CoA hydratase/isomerase family protein [Candidatus Paracaedibacteraceae bacterium]